VKVGKTNPWRQNRSRCWGGERQDARQRNGHAVQVEVDWASAVVAQAFPTDIGLYRANNDERKWMKSGIQDPELA
jgi:hypothetical protein